MQQNRDVGSWGKNNLSDRLLESIGEMHGDIHQLDIDKLAPFDQFHRGGKDATVRLAEAANLKVGARVLDVGGGLGGPARTLATKYNCNVTVIEPTPSYISAGKLLTDLLHLGDKVRHIEADALELPKFDTDFDVVWTQNSGMNIRDKQSYYNALHRVLRLDGVLAIQEPVAGLNAPPIYPLMWAEQPSESFLLKPSALLQIIEESGFETLKWAPTEYAVQPKTRPVTEHSIQLIIRGDTLKQIEEAGRRNIAEDRISSYQGIFTRRLR